MIMKFNISKIIVFAIGILFPFISFAQLVDISDISLYPKLHENTSFEMQSSYDRTGGNDDGFNGTHSVIRLENGNAVIAETEGKGMITRIWFPYHYGYPNAPMWLADKRIFIYLDGADSPVIDLPAVELFNRSNKNFPYPLCGMELGGCWCHLPIPFNKGAKLVVEGEKAGFFQIQFTKVNDDREWKTFRLDANPFAEKTDELMASIWHLGDIDFLELESPTVQEEEILLTKGKNEIKLLDGSQILRAFIVEAEGLDLNKFLEGNLKITWDDDGIPAVDVPLSMFFIQEPTGTHSKSLMAGLLPGGKGVYNFFPMPYMKRARLKITVPEDCKVQLKFIYESQNMLKSDFTYFHAVHHIDMPTTPGKKHCWLDVKGTGHYVGVYMRAEGKGVKSGPIYFTPCLEGDETFFVDGKMVAHGTGTEDYFNAGWNGDFTRLDHAKSMAFHGYTLFDASKNICRAASYRWHLPNEVIPFSESIKGEIEVGPTDNLVGNYESVAFYYLK